MAINRNKPMQIWATDGNCQSPRDATVIRANAQLLWVVPSDAMMGERVIAFDAVTGLPHPDCPCAFQLRNKLGPVRVVLYDDGTARWHEEGAPQAPALPLPPGAAPLPAIIGIANSVVVRRP